MSLLSYTINKTLIFLDSMPKSIRKQKGQFFTSCETALFMASLFDFSHVSGEISVLDPGAGTGILTAAFVENLQSNEKISGISITCYETDTEVLPVLEENLAYIQSHSSIKIEFCIVRDDYLLTQIADFSNQLSLNRHDDPKKYDFIIGNPPYLKIAKNHPAAIGMPSVVHGAPNLYFLFTAMSLFNLKEDSEMVYIIPRSWTSGAYFKAFRKYLLQAGKLRHLHLFVSRDKVFSQESVLQETIIIKLTKQADVPESVTLTSSQSDKDFGSLTSLTLPYNSIVSGEDWYVFLPTSQDEANVIRTINKYNQTLPEIGLRMKTGIVVDFRQKEELRTEKDMETVPLFYSQHISSGRVNHNPSGKKYDWVTTRKKGLIQENKNYLFCKRFTAKEEKRRLQCGIYQASDYPEFKNIATQNKINFVDDIHNGRLTLPEVYGIYALFNSSLFDTYYRILNGSTQVNSTEINNIPVPSREQIIRIGEILIKKNDLSTEECDRVINEVAYEQENF